MSRATQQPITTLWTRFRDPYLRAAFRAAENDGTAPEMIEVYTGRDKDGALVSAVRPRNLDGGAVVSAELVEA
jgi:hypothetical protein